MKSTLPTRSVLPLCTLLTVGVLALIASAPARAGAIPSVDDPLRTGSKAPADGGVVIGIEDYVRNEIPDVPYAARDAQAFNDFLVSTRGVPTDRVRRIVSGASAAKIRSAVTALGQSVHAGGVAWVYFAGHGGASLDGGKRMVLGDDVSNDPETFDVASVPVAELERLAGAGGGRVVIVVDACYTGVGRTGTTVLTGQRAVVPGGYTALRPADNVVWTAASAGQTSGPFEAARHGAFTYFALGALRGWADGDIDGVHDGSVTMDEAHSYVQRALMTAQITSQTPELIGARDLVLSVKAQEAAPVIEPGRLSLPVATPAAIAPAAPATPPVVAVAVAVSPAVPATPLVPGAYVRDASGPHPLQKLTGSTPGVYACSAMAYGSALWNSGKAPLYRAYAFSGPSFVAGALSFEVVGSTTPPTLFRADVLPAGEKCWIPDGLSGTEPLPAKYNRRKGPAVPMVLGPDGTKATPSVLLAPGDYLLLNSLGTWAFTVTAGP